MDDSGREDEGVADIPVVRLHDLTKDEFARWSSAHGYAELAQLLLFRWDPDGVANDYPISALDYHSEAQSIVLGLWMGDDREVFARRLRNNNRFAPGSFLTDESIEELWGHLTRWLPLSIFRWWHEFMVEGLRALPFHCHLIKYDPDRSVNGHYDDGSWTAISDVGREFDGIVFTMDDYLATERAHLDSLRAMAVESGATRFRVESDRSSTIGLDELLDQVRAALREEQGSGYWWSSEDLDFYVNVGYDYHVYVGSRVDCVEGLQVASGAGLHPRLGDGPSPYLTTEVAARPSLRAS
ncbi:MULTISPECIES: hypothetical protein [unclassified Nocardioides]|uniref:hypothetical protein n=1 Tax=unclassified Nocardioides TaxID=2615069 RepID=UPI0012E3CCDF|nr:MULTISPECIES: hypothetical protein [unclassified Nocardioides]